MEMIDGYGEELSKCNIVNVETGKVINEGIELHDKCVEFLVNLLLSIPFTTYQMICNLSRCI